MLLEDGRERSRADAADALATRLRDDPDLIGGWRMLADLREKAGDVAGAARAHLRHVAHAASDPRLRAAATALNRQELPIAERLLKAHLAEHPTDVAAMRMLAELAGRLGRNRDAEPLLRRALALAPGFAMARYNLAIVLHRQHRAIEALVEIERLLDEEPDNAAYRNLAGAIHGGTGDHAAALVQFEAALDGQSDNPHVWMSYGHTLKTLGRVGEGIAAYRRSLALRPTMGEAWWSLANLKTVCFDDADLAAMETALRASETGHDDRFHLHFALGKAHEDRERWQAAFDHYVEGNRLRRARIDYDPGEIGDQVARAMALFSPAFLAARAGAGARSDAPIFILGMPRSGSTLIEQILASHPMVEGTRELPEIQAIAQRLSRRVLRKDRSAYPEVLAGLDPEALAALGEEYLERTSVYRTSGRPRFIDKMPNNWLHVGLIRLILPKATIVDARRHPLACCLSNFKQHFARGQAFSYSLDELGRYYRDYAALMAHFDRVAPGTVHRVSHEALVADVEGEVRRLLAACGLPFDPACLRFWETKRAVQTASSEQVRRPIFRDGIDRWRHFAPWLGPLETALGDALDPEGGPTA